MRYVIMGPGGIGGVLGARLFAIGKDVALVARGSHLEALQKRGLRLVTPSGEEHYRIPTVGHVSELPLGSDHMVILAMKSQDTMGAINDLARSAPQGVGVVCAQNGVDNERVALRQFSEVYAMCVVLPGGHFQPGVVVQWSSPCAGVLDVGRFPYVEDERARGMAADLEAAGFHCEVDPNVMRKKYSKLLTNLLNALDALCGAEARHTTLARRVQEEGLAVLKAAGIQADIEGVEQARWAGVVTVAQIEGHPYRGSSSSQSLLRSTGSIETDWLNGEIVLLGRLHQVPTPLNELLQREANLAARQHRPPGSLSVEDLEDRLKSR